MRRRSEDAAGLPATAFKRVPPVGGALHVPLATRSAAVSALAMYAACRPRAMLAQRLAAWWVFAFGPAALPGRAVHWAPPLPEGPWRELLAGWRETLGTFDAIAVHERSQRKRGGVILLLLRRGAPVAFVRMNPERGSKLAREADVLRRLAEFGPRSFSAPSVLAAGETNGWRFLALSPLAAGFHRPATDPAITEVTREIGEALGSLPRPEGTPPHWRPMHGDLTPWNLRRLTTGGLGLFDWEDAGWGPPGADEVLYRAAATSLGLKVSPTAAHREEARRFWEMRITRNHAAGERRDLHLGVALLRALAGRPSPGVLPVLSQRGRRPAPEKA